MNAGSMIADSARAFLSKIGGTARARKLRDSGTAFDRDAWSEMAQLGWFGLLIGEESGGLGLGGRELADLMEQLGAHLAGEPVAEAIATGAAIAAADPSHPILADIVAGTAIPIPVEGAFNAVNGRITGVSAPVANLSGATHLLLATAGEGERLVLVPLGTSGVARKTLTTVDGGTMDLLTLDVRLGDAMTLPLRNAPAAASRAGDLRRLAYAAYLAGLADASFAIALDYLRTRKQFGVPIGTFQALQHRAATVYVRIASVRALVSEACAALETEKLPAASAAAAFSAADMALAVTKECIQFHGAIGFADEHQVGLFLKRALAVAGSIGTGDECLDRYFDASRNLNETNNISTAA